MPATSAAPLTPLAVLVLAWDEAAPAVRTVIEAATALGPLLVMLPPAEAQAEAALINAEPVTQPLTEAAPLPTPLPVALAEPTVSGSPETAALPALPPTLAVVHKESAVASPLTTLPAAEPTSSQSVLPIVRVLRLTQAAVSPPRIVASTSAVPAAPYLGATPTVPAPTAATVSNAVALRAELPAIASAPAAAPLPTPQVSPAPSLALPADELAPDLEADLLPAYSSTAETESVATLDLPAADNAPVLGADPAPLVQPELLPAPPAPEPTVLPTAAAEAPSAVETDSEAPAADPEEATRREAHLHVVAQPPLPLAAETYAAPDLNKQVITYARRAVPMALTEGDFEAIYAPAWPTWLAALELQQRTRRPLVLHLRALAAGQQPADTAAGWQAELQRQVLRQADLVLTETYSLARRLRRELGLATASVRVVPASNGAAIARALRRAQRRPSA